MYCWLCQNPYQIHCDDEINGHHTSWNISLFSTITFIIIPLHCIRMSTCNRFGNSANILHTHIIRARHTSTPHKCIHCHEVHKAKFNWKNLLWMDKRVNGRMGGWRCVLLQKSLEFISVVRQSLSTVQSPVQTIFQLRMQPSAWNNNKMVSLFTVAVNRNCLFSVVLNVMRDIGCSVLWHGLGVCVDDVRVCGCRCAFYSNARASNISGLRMEIIWINVANSHSKRSRWIPILNI